MIAREGGREREREIERERERERKREREKTGDEPLENPSGKNEGPWLFRRCHSHLLHPPQG